MTKKIIGNKTFGDMLVGIYNDFFLSRYVGFYQFHKPILMLKDPDLIEFVCEKNHLSFQNHSLLVPSHCDTLWNKTLYSLRGQSWLRARSHLTPFFVDKRMKNLFDVTQSYAYDFTNSLVTMDKKILEANFKELFSKCSTEIMARSVYDLENRSFKNVNSMFYTKMRAANEDFSIWRMIKLHIAQTFPCFGKVLGSRVFNETLRKFFLEITSKIMRHREKFGIEKQDLISLLMNLRRRDIDRFLLNIIMEHDPGEEISNEFIESEMRRCGIDLTEETIVAQSMTFFYFGYDVISTVLSFLFYELAMNNSVQNKLIQELDDLKKQPKVSFSDLFKLNYLSMVISETLRKWPPFYFTERVCNKNLTLLKTLPNENDVIISAGDTVWIPIWAIHRDSRYWWQPELFDPERFRPSNHHKLPKYTFLPFGAGPRRCAAIKLALMQIKIIVSEILTIFEIVPVRNTAKEILLDYRTFNLCPKDGIILGLKKRFM